MSEYPDDGWQCSCECGHQWGEYIGNGDSITLPILPNRNVFIEPINQEGNQHDQS